MGDGSRLKELIDEKGTNVRKIAKATGISATTLYTIISRDSNIRFDYALRLANELDIDVESLNLWPEYSMAVPDFKTVILNESVHS